VATLKDGDVNDRLHDLAVSYDLSIGVLSDSGRRLLSVLAVLPNGAALRDLDGIFADHDDGAAIELQRRALVADEEGRLRMRAPLREHVATAYRPEPSDAERVVRHYLAIAGNDGAKVGSAGGAEAVVRLTPELANIEEMFARSADQPEINDAVHGWGEFMRFAGIGTRAPIEEIGRRASAGGNSQLAARCAETLGDVALSRSEYERAQERLEAALVLYRQLGNVLDEANCTQSLGDIAMRRSNHVLAQELFETALSLYRQVGVPAGRGELHL
jgi:tetratricopeptide (TPR) repeat protein